MSMPAEKVIEIVKKNLGKRPVVVGFNAPKTTLAVKGSAILQGDVFLDLQDEATDRMEKMNADAETYDSAKSVRAILGSLRKQYLQGEVGAVNKILQDAGTGWFATPPIEGDRVIRVKDMAKMRSLPAEAFYNCDAEKIIVPSTITTIGEDFCAVCLKLKQVVFEGPVKEIPARAFEATDALETVAFAVPGLEKIGEGAFRSSGIRRLGLPGTVKEIADNAFEKCARLEWISGPGVEKIGKGAFRGCPGLQDADFPKCKDLAGTGLGEVTTEAAGAGGLSKAQLDFLYSRFDFEDSPGKKEVIRDAYFDKSRHGQFVIVYDVYSGNSLKEEGNRYEPDLEGEEVEREFKKLNFRTVKFADKYA